VYDVAEYILRKRGPLSAMKLQKLVYYSQAWSLVWDEKPIFSDKIKAWANGPVVPSLYHRHKGRFMVEPGSIGGDASLLEPSDYETVDAVLGFYGDKSAQWLSDLSHQEGPWRQARDGTADGENSESEITHAAMAEYYSTMAQAVADRSPR